MSSTNKTEKLNLSQFISTDKPAWLTDYNNDMQKIDQGIKDVQGTMASAVEASKVSGIAAYTHAKSGSVHTLTGKGDNIKFKATADFVQGDTIEVGGVSLEIRGIPAWETGDTVMALLDGGAVNFIKGGGSLGAIAVASVAELPSAVKPGTIAFVTSLTPGPVRYGRIKPNVPRENDVWVGYQRGSAYAFEVNLNGNILPVNRAEIYSGGEWINPESYIFCNGIWNRLIQMIYDAGRQYMATTTVLQQSAASGGTVVFNPTNIKCNTAGSSAWKIAGVVGNNTITMDSYKTLMARASCSVSATSGGGAIIGMFSSKTVFTGNASASVANSIVVKSRPISRDTTDALLSVDIASRTGSGYWSLYTYSNTEAQDLTIQTMWLE